MKTKHKIISGFLFTGLTVISTACFNKLLFMAATSKESVDKKQLNCYQWRFGDIYYKKTGKGSPLLLIHDFTPGSSHYEWNRVEKYLKKDYTIYTLDLLGCGISDKPNITYTNFLYVQLISDFIRDIIGESPNVVCSGSASAFAIMACNNNEELFNRIILINPDSIGVCNQTPDKHRKAYKFILDTPVIGTLIYNIAFSKLIIKESFENEYIYKAKNIKSRDISRYHENAHIGGIFAKYIYSSIKGNYTTISINKALEKINNTIVILGSEYEKDIYYTIKEYEQINPAIESTIINSTKHLPHLENPKRVAVLIRFYFS